MASNRPLTTWRAFWRALLFAALVGLGLVAGATAATSGRPALVVHLQGPIGPASADYVARRLAEAQSRGAAMVILRLDTPGGLDTSMRDIIRDIIASPVPVATYVAPGGARAASAGTYILYASHVAAMAPGTNVGAATPVAIGGFPGGRPEPERPPSKGWMEAAGQGAGASDGQPPAAPKGAAEAKATNDAVAYIRGLAHLRGRNADWGEGAVRDAASLDASEALRQKAIDFVARDVPHLLEQAHGRTVTVNNTPTVLNTRGLAIEEVRPNWRDRLLATITNPNVALILMMIGVYGLIFEFMNPGALYPGTIGAICLMIGLYALAVLPVNYVGVGLIVLGMGLIVAEAFAPSFGILGIGGVAAVVVGGMILIDTDVPGLELSLPLVAGLAVCGLALSSLVLRLAWTSRGRRVVSGREQMIGAAGIVEDWGGGAGHVLTHSERWRAVADAALQPGDRVRVTEVDGLTLTVARQEDRNRHR